MYSLIMVDDTPKPSSIHREARYKQLDRPQSFKDAMIILSDEYIFFLRMNYWIGKIKKNQSIDLLH